ncbi:hypothetical protein EDC04DRAFT_2898600 [Pisolithus marmoratus]|nr:hypothetical protein EDC04DRAFT_2898600 [Pisolithus marmoratus]
MKILLNIIRTSEDKEIQGSKATVERIAGTLVTTGLLARHTVMRPTEPELPVIVAFIIPHPAIVHSLHILFTARAFTLRQIPPSCDDIPIFGRIPPHNSLAAISRPSGHPTPLSPSSRALMADKYILLDLALVIKQLTTSHLELN